MTEGWGSGSTVLPPPPHPTDPLYPSAQPDSRLCSPHSSEHGHGSHALALPPPARAGRGPGSPSRPLFPGGGRSGTRRRFLRVGSLCSYSCGGGHRKKRAGKKQEGVFMEG